MIRNIMVNGLPGSMAKLIAERIRDEVDLDLVPYSFTGPEIAQSASFAGNIEMKLVRPGEREDVIKEILNHYKPLMAVDFTSPSAVLDNVAFYAKYHIPFVLGTTGGNDNSIWQMVRQARIHAVVAPNMAMPVIWMQAMIEQAAERFPGILKGYTLEIVESHQAGKADTSGTAKAMVGYFNKLGLKFAVEQITKIRDRWTQSKMLGVPNDALDGHGWHTYSLKSLDGSVTLEFRHNVNGRDVYVDGTISAIRFLMSRPSGTCGVFNMIDVMSCKK